MTKIIAAALAAGLITISAMGQSFARVRVPFAFFVGGVELPAGSYELEAVSANAMRITNLDDRNKAVAFNPVGVRRNEASSNTTVLVFTRYATDHYLSEVWPSGTLTGRAIVKSSQEIELAKKVHPVRIESITASRP